MPFGTSNYIHVFIFSRIVSLKRLGKLFKVQCESTYMESATSATLLSSNAQSWRLSVSTMQSASIEKNQEAPRINDTRSRRLPISLTTGSRSDGREGLEWLKRWHCVAAMGHFLTFYWASILFSEYINFSSVLLKKRMCTMNKRYSVRSLPFSLLLFLPLKILQHVQRFFLEVKK